MKTLIASLAIAGAFAFAIGGFASTADARWGNQDQGYGRMAQAQGQGRMGAAQRGTGPNAALMQNRLDADRDGGVSKDEFLNAQRPGRGANTDFAKSNRAAHFDLLDANKDGKLSADELSATTAAKR